MRIYLIGFMGSGKSYVGKRIAERIGISFMDLDAYIEEKEGRSITEIFKIDGEAHFRDLEHQYLKESIQYDNLIVATGGGTPCFTNNMDFINANGMSVYLEVDIPILVGRLKGDQAHRPLIAEMNEAELADFIKNKLLTRQSFYEKAHVIYHFTKTNQKIVEEITKYIESMYEI